MLSYLTSLVLFLLLATITKSQTNGTSSTSTTTVAPVTTTTSSTTPSTTTSTTTSTTRIVTSGVVTSITLIRNNATSNYLLWPFASTDENFTLPFAIDQCSLFNLNANYFLKPTCVSDTLVNVTFYNDSGCTFPYNYQAINNTSVFRCNESNNYAELVMSNNASCSSPYTTYVGINYCFPTLFGYASILCSGQNVQYAEFNSSSCINNGLLTISQVNSTTCGSLINNATYISLSECVNNATMVPSTTVPSTTVPVTSTTSSTTASTTSSTTASTTPSTTSTTTTTRGVTTTTTAGATTSTSTTTTRSPSSGSSVFIFNNAVYILSIITIFNIIN